MPRKGDDEVPSRGPGSPAWHLPRPVHDADHRTSPRARRHERRAVADPSLCHRPTPRGARAGELLGLRLDRLPRARFTLRARGSSRRIQADGAGLHSAGLEVILDVAYNHTPEGNHLGPTVAFKGIDNPAYYPLVPDEQR